MESKLVSIILAVYNGEKTLKKSVQSVLDQEYRNFELLIVNDGSQDGTGRVIDELNDERIRRIDLPVNQGVSIARNKGLELMKGDFLCFFDADDFMPVKSLSSRMSLILDQPEIWFVDGIVEKRDLISGKLLEKYIPNFKGDPLKELIQLNSSCFVGQTWLVRNDFQKLPLFEDGLTHGEDLLFFIKCCAENRKYTYTEEVVLVYNRHVNSAMENLSGLEKFYRNHLKRADKYVDQEVISLSEKETLRQKIRKIMFRSYLKQMKPIKAFQALFIS